MTIVGRFRRGSFRRKRCHLHGAQQGWIAEGRLLMQRPQMRTLLSLGLLLVSVPAAASQPSGKTYGSWHVVSIWSFSGTEGNDPSLILMQGEEPNTLQVHWTQAGPVVVSINIDKCSGDDDFEASYSMVVQRWLRGCLKTRRKRDCGPRSRDGLIRLSCLAHHQWQPNRSVSWV